MTTLLTPTGTREDPDPGPLATLQSSNEPSRSGRAGVTHT